MGTLVISENNVELFVIEQITSDDAKKLAKQLVDSAKFKCEAEFFVNDFWEWQLTKETMILRRA